MRWWGWPKVEVLAEIRYMKYIKRVMTRLICLRLQITKPNRRNITKVTIEGVVNEVPPIPCIYMNLEHYEDIFGVDSNQSILISCKNLNSQQQLTVSKEIERQFKAGGIEILKNWNTDLLQKAFVEHLKIIVNFLCVIALLAVVVGGLSIASAIGLNITERRRELGILKAIGVNSYQMVLTISVEVIIMQSLYRSYRD